MGAKWLIGVSGRFDAKTNRSENGCLEWTGARKPNGYGKFWDGTKKDVSTHRFAWARANGPIPDGLCVLHRCDNRLCVDPAHLFLGTRGDNNRDATIKRRNARGEKHGRSKLTAAQVAEIRQACAAGEFQPAVAARFGVCRETVNLIHNRKIWV